jgi:Tol biopolymer transport system component
MGEVYRARDTRLEREVAIKVLPEHFADDEERLKRFEREAKTLATLHHPNVASIFGIDQVGDVCFLALELVPGEDLATRLARGRLPVDEALDVCRQIAEGLEAAHEAGVVHRDLKPANVRITPDGKVKVLDFGLAKPAGPDVGRGSTTDSVLATEEGRLLGTPTYMSPEQARGKGVDRRTDIWAFGCVLYECLTGKRPFEGEAFGDLVAAILEHEVDLGALPDRVPPRVRELLARCLTKDPRRRLRDIGEARCTLESPGRELAPSGAGPAAGGRSGSPAAPGRWIGALAVVGSIAALAGWWLGTRGQAPPESWSRFTQLTDLEGAETAPALSPDGSSFAYASRADGSWDIFVQRVGGRTRTAVAADPERDEAWPAFSPDGNQIAYNESDEDGGIWITGATGESARRLTDFGFNPTWSPGGDRIAFATEEADDPYARKQHTSTIWIVPVAGGPPLKVSESDAMQPAWSPSGARIAVWRTEGGQRDLATIPAEGGEARVLLDDAPLDWSPTWSPDGASLYFASDRGGSMGLWRLAVDESTGESLGEPEPVVGGLETSVALPSFSADGSVLAFRSKTVTVNPFVIPFDPETEVAGPPRELFHRTGRLFPTGVSPDGEWLALFNLGEIQEDVFLARTDGTELRRLTDDPARDRGPEFSPDGSRITFISNRGGEYAGYSIRTDGSALSLLAEGGDEGVRLVSFEPGGERLLVSTFDGFSVLASPPWPVEVDALEHFAELHFPAGTLAVSSWSPDGRKLVGALTREVEGGNSGIGVFDLTTGEGRQLGADEMGGKIAWLQDSQRILYLSKGELVVMDVDSGERREIPVDLPVPPALDMLTASPDGTAIYFGAERVESNIWTVERAP